MGVEGQRSEGRSSRVQEVTYKEPENKYRGLGVGLLVIQIGCMIGYGIEGQYYEEQDSILAAANYNTISLIMVALFTIVGFGLLLSSYRHGTWLGMASAIVVVAISIQLSPILQTLWFQTFNTGFRGEPTFEDVGPTVQTFWRYFYKSTIDASIFKMRISFLSCISILTMLTAVIGRISFANLIQIVTFFQITWTLNFNLLIFMATSHKDFNPAQFHGPQFFDTYGTTFIYLFAGFYGLGYSCLHGIKFPSNNFRNQNSRFSLTLSLMGTGFIFATFLFTANGYVSYSTKGFNRSIFAILFAMIGSVLGTYLGSSLTGARGKIGFKECIVGTISGGVVIGSIAPVIEEMWVAVMIGILNGIICGIYMRTVHKVINKTFVKDSMGLFGPFLISALMGSMVVVCSILAHNRDNNKSLPTFEGLKVEKDLIGYQLVYVGISAGIGLASGIVTALFTKCSKNNLGIGANSRYFSHDFGLFVPVEEEVGGEYMDTNQQLKDKQLA